MPKYSFQCRNCGTGFTVNVPWQEKENAQCPKCGSKDKSPDYSKVGVIAGSACPIKDTGGICPSTGAT
ncbi:MAG: FmdB family zinc ribbon protein [Bacillota bacterium]|jgi:putative FmdB family regulatory protein|nr:zinc ribbon domain-containing protein [Clostridia bacterium]